MEHSTNGYPAFHPLLAPSPGPQEAREARQDEEGRKNVSPPPLPRFSAFRDLAV